MSCQNPGRRARASGWHASWRQKHCVADAPVGLGAASCRTVAGADPHAPPLACTAHARPLQRATSQACWLCCAPAARRCRARSPLRCTCATLWARRRLTTRRRWRCCFTIWRARAMVRRLRCSGRCRGGPNQKHILHDALAGRCWQPGIKAAARQLGWQNGSVMAHTLTLPLPAPPWGAEQALSAERTINGGPMGAAPSSRSCWWRRSAAARRRPQPPSRQPARYRS